MYTIGLLSGVAVIAAVVVIEAAAVMAAVSVTTVVGIIVGVSTGIDVAEISAEVGVGNASSLRRRIIRAQPLVVSAIVKLITAIKR